MHRIALLLLLAITAPAGNALAELVATDDTGREVRLERPAARIVGLAPHVVELLYAAGAGERMVGAVNYADHPPAARGLPQVGGYNRLDLEAVLALEPDLVVGWASGNPPEQLERLRGLGIAVYTTEPRSLDGIARNMERLGRLAGTGRAAGQAARAFRDTVARLTERHGDRPTVRVFYQVWHEPLMTIDGEHLISRAIERCGGKNVFQELKGLAAPVSLEAVLAEDPEAIIASGMGEARPEWLDMWREWPGLSATRRGNLFFIPPSLIQRHGPRIVEGMRQLCAHLETARSRRPQPQPHTENPLDSRQGSDERDDGG